MQLPGPWIVLFAAILVEVCATTLLKRSNGMSHPFYAVLALSCYLFAIWLFSLVQRWLPMGIVYALWSGLGMVLVTLAAWLFWNETIQPWGLLGMGLILVGVVVLQATSPMAEKHVPDSTIKAQRGESSGEAP